MNQEADQDHPTYLARGGIEQDQVELSAEKIEEGFLETLIQIPKMGTDVATDVATDEAKDKADKGTVKIYLIIIFGALES